MGGGGGGSEVIYLNWCWGGGEGGKFLGGSNSSLKKIRPSTIWKDFCDKRLPQKLLWGGKPNNAPPPHSRKRDPPHTEKMAWPPRTWREKTAHIKIPHRGNSPPPRWIFLFMLPPPGERLYPPPCVRRS